MTTLCSPPQSVFKSTPLLCPEAKKGTLIRAVATGPVGQVNRNFVLTVFGLLLKAGTGRDSGGTSR